MPCKIHCPALISTRPDLRGLDRTVVCGFIGETKSSTAQFKGYFLVHTVGEDQTAVKARYVKTG